MAGVTIGEVVVDWISTVVDADFFEARSFVRSLGGNASNVAIGLARLGTPVKLIGKRGDDPHGRYLESVLINENVNLEHLMVDRSSPTAQCYVFRHAHEEYSFLNWPRPNASHMLSEDEIKSEQLDGAAFLHATGISLTVSPRRQAVLKALALASNKGILVSFDAGFPTGEDEEARKSARQALTLASLIKVNLAELKFWSQTMASDHCVKTEMTALRDKGLSTASDLDGGLSGVKVVDRATGEVAVWVHELAQSLVSRLDAHLVITLGSEGALMAASDRKPIFAPAFKVDSVSELGAGDAFMAGLLHSLHRVLKPGASLFEISDSEWTRVLRFASAVGALSTMAETAWETLPTKDMVEKLAGTGDITY